MPSAPAKTWLSTEEWPREGRLFSLETEECDLEQLLFDREELRAAAQSHSNWAQHREFLLNKRDGPL